MSYQFPQPIGPDWKLWAKRFVDTLSATRSQLVYYVTGDSAATDGLLLFDPSGYPVVSKSGSFKQILLAGGCGQFYTTATQTPSQANTGYAIPFSAASSTDGLAINASDATKIDVTNAGLLQVTVTAQATASSAYTGYLWINVNGTDGYAVKKTVSGDDTMALTALVTVGAGNYLKVFYAASNTGLTLPNTAASSPLPAIPAVQVSITNVKQ